MALWPASFMADEVGVVHTPIKVLEIVLRRDYAECTITGRDRQGYRHTLHFGPGTKVHKLPEGVAADMSEVLRQTQRFPLVKDQEVLVTWKLYLPKRQKVALKLTYY